MSPEQPDEASKAQAVPLGEDGRPTFLPPPRGPGSRIALTPPVAVAAPTSRLNVPPVVTARPAPAPPLEPDLTEHQRGVRRHKLFMLVLGAMIVLSSADLLAATIGLAQEVSPRPLTQAEQADYVRQSLAERWRTLSTTEIFPERIDYLGLGGVPQRARRVGVAPQTNCEDGVDPAAAQALTGHGCEALLRATYTDQSATFAVAVGVAVLADEPAREKAGAELPIDERTGLRPVAFPGTMTERFGPAQRQRTGWTATGRYIVFSTAGYTDGRTREAVPPDQIVHSELWPTAESIAWHVTTTLGEAPAVPRCTRGTAC